MVDGCKIIITGYAHSFVERCVFAMPLDDVDGLSDDDASGRLVLGEAVAATPQSDCVVSVAQPSSRKRKLPGDRSIVSMATLATLRQVVRRQVGSKCPCSRRRSKMMVAVSSSCFHPFRTPTLLEQLIGLRKTLISMAKEDSDKQALQLQCCN